MEELYLKKYDFNKAIFIDELNKIIKKNGGVFVKDWNGSEYPIGLEIEPKKIYNRYITEGCFDFEEETAKKLEGKNIPSEIITNSDLSYTSFILNDIYYYLQIDENPFFDDYIIKKPVEKIENKKYSFISYKNYYMEKVTKDLKDIYWKLYNYLTVKQIRNLAKKAFELIKAARLSNIVTERKKIQNYYNNRYHYENIAEKRELHYFIIER